MATVELEIPSRSVYVGVVRLAVASLARASGLDEERVDDLRIAVSEACANALGSDAESGRSPIRVRWSEEDSRVLVEVEDKTSSTYRSCQDGATDDRLGLSLELLRSLVDECDITPSDSGGTLTRMVVAR